MEAEKTKPSSARAARRAKKKQARFESRPRSTRIVSTIGPASKPPEMIERLIRNGMNVARLNFSHGSHDSHLESIQTIREVSKHVNRPVAILQDLQGHKVRVGMTSEEDSVTLKEGQ